MSAYSFDYGYLVGTSSDGAGIEALRGSNLIKSGAPPTSVAGMMRVRLIAVVEFGKTVTR